MRTKSPHLLAYALLLLSASCMAVKVGDPVTKVTKELGAPTARIPMGAGKVTLIYPRGDVVVKDGFVESTRLVSIEEFEKAKEAARKRDAEEAERRKPKPAVEPEPQEPEPPPQPNPLVPKAPPQVSEKWYKFGPLSPGQKAELYITEFEAANYEEFTCLVNNDGPAPIGPLTVVVRFVCNDGCAKFNAILRPYEGDSSVIYPGSHSRFFGEVSYSREGLNWPGGTQSTHFNGQGVTAQIDVYIGREPIPVGQGIWVTKGFESKARKPR